MRLINADELEVYSVTVPEDCDIESYMEGAGDVLEIIDKMPTIEAIPVEWIEKYIYKHGLYTCAMEVISAWREEQRETE